MEEEGKTPDMNRKDFLRLCVYVCACAPASFSYETRIPWKKDLKKDFFSCSLIAIYILLYIILLYFVCSVIILSFYTGFSMRMKECFHSARRMKECFHSTCLGLM